MVLLWPEPDRVPGFTGHQSGVCWPRGSFDLAETLVPVGPEALEGDAYEKSIWVRFPCACSRDSVGHWGQLRSRCSAGL